MLLYADENFYYPVIAILRQFGHDVLTVQEDGRRSSPDPMVLARSHELGRIVLTLNRRDFERLDRQGADHFGIVSTTRDNDYAALAQRILTALAGRTPGRWCIRVNRPPRATP